MSKPQQTLATPKPKKIKAKIGRPTVMTPEVCEEICQRITRGETLSAICRDKHMPNRTSVLKCRAENSAFALRYAQARELLLDVYADDIIMISDDGTTDYVLKVGRNGHEYEAVDQEHIQRSRLRVDSRKWLLSKLRPNEYGDKLIRESTSLVLVKHDIGSLSGREKMRRFALFMMEDGRQPAIEGEASEVPAADGAETQASPASKKQGHDTTA